MTQSKADADLPLDPSIGTHVAFISHRGIGMKRTFANCLYHSLKQRGIKAFLDMEELSKGDDVRPFMLEAARRAIIQIPIITSNYAESTWCLEELSIMMSTERSNNTKVLPVFYDVKPEVLRNEDGPFGDAIKSYRNKGKRTEDEIQRWEHALNDASWRDGFRLETYNNREGALLTDLVEKIVQEIRDRTAAEVNPYIVGLEWRVLEVVEHFHLKEEGNVHFLLLWGMGGIGKTTLAQAIFNRLRKEFHATSFVATCGVKAPDLIQHTLLNDLLLDHKSSRDIGTGRKYLKDCLTEKKILIVLDDVKVFKSIEEVIDLTSLHPGSVILVTSRDQSVFPHESALSNVFKGDCYEVLGMNGNESLQLLCLHAFKRPSPKPGFEEVAQKVSQACHGLPLSLEVLGRHLSRKTDQKMWGDAIVKLRSSKYREIEHALMISYEDLNDEEQEMFLDVACLLINKNKRSVEFFWDGLVEAWSTGLESLVDLGLVKLAWEDSYERIPLGTYESLTMHDQLRDLGRAIVKKEYNNSGKWSRVWNNDDLSRVMQRKQGLDQIRGLATSLPTLSTGVLSQMLSLKLLFLDGTHLDGDTEGLGQLEIRWLDFCCYDDAPKELIDTNFLTVLTLRARPSSNDTAGEMAELSDSNLWPRLRTMSMNNNLFFSNGRLKKLRKLEIKLLVPSPLPEYFGSLKSLEELVVLALIIPKLPPSFGQLKKLRELEMISAGEMGLEQLPEEFGSLENLEVFKVFRLRITKLPFSFGQLKKLRELRLCCCMSLEQLPEDFGSLESLETLQLHSLAITRLPSSIRHMKKLRELVLLYCKQLEQLPEDFGSLESLEKLELISLAITRLPSSFGQMKKLRELRLIQCKRLEQLPEDFESLESLEKLELISLAITRLPSSFGQMKKLRELELCACEQLEQLPEDFGSLESLQELRLKGLPIRMLPSSFVELKKLRKLGLISCQRLEQMPEGFQRLKSLCRLDMRGTITTAHAVISGLLLAMHSSQTFTSVRL